MRVLVLFIIFVIFIIYITEPGALGLQ